jgi:hypothetical protein
VERLCNHCGCPMPSYAHERAEYCSHGCKRQAEYVRHKRKYPSLKDVIAGHRPMTPLEQRTLANRIALECQDIANSLEPSYTPSALPDEPINPDFIDQPPKEKEEVLKDYGYEPKGLDNANLSDTKDGK